MKIDLKDMDSTQILALACVVLCIFVPFGIALDRPTKYQSYNEAIRHCSTFRSMNERNACRTQVTNTYKMEWEKNGQEEYRQDMLRKE
jgi:hypothetical protein